MATRRLSGLDAAYLAAETSDQPFHVMAALVLDPASVPGGYSFEAFRDFIARRLDRVPPMRRRLVQVPLGLGRPRWVEEPGVDLDLHVHRAALPAPGGARELAALAAELDAHPLDRSRPLWEMHVVEGLEGGRLAVLAKLHHAMMDGVAGMQFMGAFFSREPEAEEPPARPAPAPDAAPGSVELLAGAIPEALRRPLRLARAGASTLRSALRFGLRRAAGDAAAEPAARVPRTALNARASRHRTIAFTALPLDEVKDVGRAFGATVNDVVLAVVSGALRSYLGARGQLPEQPLVAGVPASTHGEGDERANAYSLLFPSLATHLGDPAERLRAIHEAAERAKGRLTLLGPEALAEWSEVPSPLFLSLASRLYSGLRLFERVPLLCNVIVSNVPGPPLPLHFGGARLLALHPLGPVYDGMILNVTTVSYEATLHVGLVGTRDGLPDLWELAGLFPESLAELAAC